MNIPLLIIITLLVVFAAYIFHVRRLRRKNRALLQQLREINRFRSLPQANMNRTESKVAVDNSGYTAYGGANGNGTGVNGTDVNFAGVSGAGGKNENIVWLACRKMEEKKLFCDPTLNRKQLADMLGTNENYLASAIREVNEGQKVSDFINEFRLDYACRLIAEFPQMKLEAIATESGFATRSTLFRLFQKKFGMSPGKYRERHMKNKK